VHYTAGAGSAFSLAAARAVPGDGVLSLSARVLLDAAGGLFGAYLLLAMGLSVYGRYLRRTAPERAPLAVLPQSWAWSPGSPLPERTRSRPGPAVPPLGPAVPADGPAVPADLPAAGALGPRGRRGALPAAVTRRPSALPPSAWPEPRAHAGLWPPTAERVPYPGRLP
jgi:hypothetical protein